MGLLRVGGGTLDIDRNMAFLAGRRVELDIGEAHAAGGKKKRNKRTKNQ